MIAVLAPVLQLYVEAPEAVNVAELPAHTVAEVTVMDGNAFTVTDVVAVFTQPVDAVPVTVYTAVVVGVTATVAVVAPVLQV